MRTVSPEPQPDHYGRAIYRYEPECDLSVIVPAYNVETYIGDCLESIRHQRTSYNFEIIVINDGSTDGSLKIIDSFAKKDTRIRVVNQSNQGFSGARNRGIDESRGYYIAFVDSDDALEPDHIQTLMDALIASKKDYVTSGYSRIDEKGRILERVPDNEYGTAWARIYKRKIWDGVRFPEQLWYEDTVLAYFVKPCYSEQTIRDTSYLYRVRSGSISHAMHGKKKAVDTYWITKRMLADYRTASLPWTERIYKTTLNQLGPLAYWRTKALPAEQRRLVFDCCCDLLRQTKEFSTFSFGGGRALKAVETALRTRNYTLWTLAGAYGTMETMIGERL
ncbi:hypothetical protein BG22_07310 [Bifidobacterium sp. UTBIF-78]|nr:hypothetical protein BG22_07310 [Bifidobacterium sp. UTBIF-78]